MKRNPYESEYKKMKAEQDRINRKIEIGRYLIEHRNYGVRKLSKEFSLGKSQVHQDLKDLRYIDDDLYVQCKNILKSHRV